MRTSTNSQKTASGIANQESLLRGVHRMTLEYRAHTIEQNIATMLLGVELKRPVPSLLHLEEEVFMLTRVFKLLGEEIKFEPSERGPRAPTLQEIIKNLRFYSRFSADTDGIRLSRYGEKVYDELSDVLKSNPDFHDIITMFKLTRKLFDDVTEQQLLLLIYDLYSEYVTKSTEYENIISERKKLSRELLKNKKITKERCEELAGYISA
jgi:hypothetical protein